MHEEALTILPQMLDRFAIDRPALIGHSDGASIALIYAAASDRPVAGLVLMAPHVMVEDMCLSSIASVRANYERSCLKDRLSKHHARADDAYGWADTWLMPEFRQWSIEDMLDRITVPMLLVQGKDDQYGTLAQLDSIETRVKGPVTRLVLTSCGHSPHRDQAAAVVDAVASFAKSWRLG